MKWFLAERDSDRALALRDDFVAGDVALHVPAHFAFEVLNALRYAPAYTEERTLQALLALEGYGFEVHDLAGELGRRAVHIAFREDLTVYDAAYLAIAREGRHPLVTADEVLVRVGGPSVQPLREYESPADG